MSNPLRRAALASITAAIALVTLAGPLASPVHAQAAWPARPITLVHGFGAGGNADVIARLVAGRLSESLKQPVVVEIKAGAGGTIASQHVARSTPDGYTLVMLTGAHTVSAALRKSLPYDPVKDFAFIGTVTAFPFVVAVRPEHPAKDLAQFVAQAKASAGKPPSFSSVGVGSTQHMTGELLSATSGAPMLHVPYRGGGAPVLAVMSGEVDVLVDTPTVAVPHVQSGKLRALAVTSPAAWPSLPGVPPAAATLPGFEVRSWLGLAAPAGTPDAVVRRLNAALQAMLREPETLKALGDAGSAPNPGTPEAMAEMVAGDIVRWKGVAASRGIQAE